jgi:hypothetical protein
MLKWLRKIVNCFHVAWDRDPWRAPVNTAVHFGFPETLRNYWVDEQRLASQGLGSVTLASPAV